MNWRWLYRIGGMAALIMVVVMRIQAVIFVISPLPQTILDFAQMLHVDMFLALVAMDVIMISDWLLFVPLFIALYMVLRRTDERYMSIALQVGLASSIIYFASNTMLKVLSLNNQFAMAMTDFDKAMTLSIGASMMTMHNGVASHISLILTSFAGMIMAIVMLRSHVFGPVAAYIGFASNLLALGLFVPVIGVWLSVMSSVGMGVWYLLIGFQLLLLSSAPLTKRQAASLHPRLQN